MNKCSGLWELRASAVNVVLRLGFDSVSMAFLMDWIFVRRVAHCYINYFAPWREVTRGNDVARHFQEFLL